MVNETEIKLSGIVKQSITDGPGLRMTIFTQGCPHHCNGCHNEETWSFQGGEVYQLSEILKILDGNPLLRGITYSGGEPLCHIPPLLALTKEVNKRGKNVICYTGYVFEDLIKKAEDDPALAELLQRMDILVDGPFVLEERDLTLAFRGSKNQRFLDLPESLKEKRAMMRPL